MTEQRLRKNQRWEMDRERTRERFNAEANRAAEHAEMGALFMECYMRRCRDD